MGFRGAEELIIRRRTLDHLCREEPHNEPCVVGDVACRGVRGSDTYQRLYR